MPVHDVTLRFLTARGTPLAGVLVKVAGLGVGATSVTGEVIVLQISPETYSLATSLLDLL